MTKSWTLSIFMTLALGLGVNGCGWLQDMQHRTGLATFRISEATINPEDGHITLHWSKAAGTDMYRAWISRKSNCADRQAMVAVPGTSHTFGRLGAGTYFACVEAVPDYDSATGDSCQAEFADVNGTGYAAKNQGLAVTVEAQRQGTWTKLDVEAPSALLVSNQGGIIIQSGTRLLVLDSQGQLVKEIAELKTLQASGPHHYASSNGQFLALSREQTRSRLFIWDDNQQNWKVVREYPGTSVLGFHLVNPNELIFLLNAPAAENLQWWSVNPSDTSTLRTVSTISLASQLGNAFYTTASVYHDGGFTIADDRGLHRVSPSEITGLTAQTGMQPQRLYHFPGAEHEFLVMGQSRNLQLAPTSIMCSFAPAPRNSWFGWSAAMPTPKLILADGYEFNHALPAGPVGMNYMVAGSFLELFDDSKLRLTPPPFRDGRLLNGPQLPEGQLLVANGKELWFFKPAF